MFPCFTTIHGWCICRTTGLLFLWDQVKLVFEIFIFSLELSDLLFGCNEVFFRMLQQGVFLCDGQTLIDFFS